jgi:outer membrane protein OmpU
MKNLLIASTALVATAGVAAADINFSGSARFGVVYDDSRATNETEVHNRFTLNIDGTAETDSGVEFFARVRVRGGNTGDTTLSASGVSAPRVGARIGGLTVAVGNINGALESTPGLYDGNIGLTGLDWGSLPTNNSGAGAFAWDSFSSSGAGSNGVEVIYSVNGFGVHVSQSSSQAGGTADRTAINVSYNFSDWTVALAHQSSDVALEDTTLLTVAGQIGNVKVGLAHADNDGDFDATRVNATFEVGAGTKVTAYYQANDGVGREDGYGLGFTHSLGGATLAGGVANSNTGATRADLGVRFNF